MSSGLIAVTAGPSDRASPPDRLAWVDAARGIGIVLVVYAHVLRGLVAAGIAAVGGLIATEDQLIYAFHMPLFFILAGLFIEGSLRSGGQAFLASKLRTIAYPYVLWSLIHGSLNIAIQGHGTNHPLAWGDLAAIGWRPIGQYWFLYVLFVCEMLAAVLLPRLRLLLAVAAIAYLAAGLLPLPGIVANSLVDLPYVVLGVALARAEPSRWLARAGSGGWLLAGSWLLFALVNAAGPGDNAGLAYLAGVAGSAGTVALAWLARGSAVLRALGRSSMAIYVMHVIFAAGARILLSRAGIHQLWIQLLVGTATGLLLPLLVRDAAVRLGVVHWLGLGRPLDRSPART